MPPKEAVKAPLKNPWLAAAAVVVGCLGAASGAAGRAPHILMFVADDTGTADLSYLGEDPDIRTPTIDRFATDGVRLSNYYVQPV